MFKTEGVGRHRERVEGGKYIFERPGVLNPRTREDVRGNGRRMFIHIPPAGSVAVNSSQKLLRRRQSENGGQVLPIVDEKDKPVRALTNRQLVSLGWIKEGEK